MFDEYALPFSELDATTQTVRRFESLAYRERREELWHREAHKGLPRFLYKFSSLNSEDKWSDSRLKDLLETGRFRLGGIKDFNDPFDAKANIQAANDPIQLQKFLKQVGQASGQLKTSKATKAVRKKLASGGIAKIEQLTKNGFSETTASMGISCFSTAPNNTLMWSHYADNHRGYCVMFERSRSVDPFLLALPVRYSKTYPRINPLLDMADASVEAICTKSQDWEYEKEFRIVIQEAAHKYLSFDVSAVVGVIVGCRASESTISRLRSLIEKSNRLINCKLYKAVPNQSLYGVNISKL